MKAEDYNKIFWQSIEDYHEKDDVNTPCNNPFAEGTLENLLYRKNWIDTVQWHLEDIIRATDIEPKKALKIKREIDASNQRRTDLVEQIDDFYFDKYESVQAKESARINTETPAWAIDRLSILNLKIYHMKEESLRKNASETHIKQCRHKLEVLYAQQNDLSQAIDQLLNEIESGNCLVKTYKQMKMYNDPELNPVLRKQS
ncbi:DUF4254 domain-containing protein [Xanthovirga aplysinae]|uniref:DUF4254 domain-containing protein n=1 Tax=Xanthovirga aplysinae TaxID=2529853 RepID=UPI0012BB83AC|nr:DUF4254 domain-containing protein [Xanthovirga aplysinae]MTI32580.1 DUF4254 domain-containing protein [Xanthovirga aplysinae]